MRLAFDATPLLDARTGVGTVVTEVLDRLARQQTIEVVAYGLTRKYRDELAARIPDGVDVITTAIPARTTRWMWERTDWPTIERWTGNVDVVHGLNFVVPPAKHAVPLVTIHDLTSFRFPELCDHNTVHYPRLVRQAVRRGAHVHAVSAFVASEVHEHLDIEDDHVHVVHNGVTPPLSGDAARGHTLAGGNRYVIAVGTIEPRKNLDVLVRAFDVLASDDSDLRLVISGARGWKSEAFDRALDANAHRDRITCTGRTTDQDHADLLAGATVMAYPSLYEGFGLPPLEAMLTGVPVVASDRGAIPEVLGDAAELVPPETEALATALREVLRSPERRTALVTRGHERASAYSWDRCASELVELYLQLASSH